MSSDTVDRMGGIALILSGVLTISTFFTLTPNGNLTSLGFILDLLSYILLLPGFLILYNRYKHIHRASSLAAVILNIAGIVVYGLLGQLIPAWTNIAGLIGVLGLVLPILLFGLSAYGNPQLGMPRILGVVGILTGIVGVLNVMIILASGGDWQNVNSSIMTTLIFISYAIPIVLSLVWSVWTGLIFLFQKPK